MAHRISYGGGS